MLSSELLDNLFNYSKNKIVNISDLKLIIDNSNEEEFKQLIFTAKFLKGMLNILTGNKASQSDKMKLMPEYTKNIAELTEILKSIISRTQNNNKSTPDYFQNKYFDLNQTSMQNFTSLISDLSICKDYFNDQKN